MDFVRRHKVKLAALCLFVGLISVIRSFYTVCFDEIGAEVSCRAPDRPVASMGGGVNPIDLGIGIILIVTAPIAVLNIRRPF